MAFCANCGAKVGDNDKFCASCGTNRVPGAPTGKPEPTPPPPVYQAAPAQSQATLNASASSESSTGMKANIAGLLCYLFGWITGIIFLVIEKKSQFVRFHAAQSLVVFGVLSILNIIFSTVFLHFWFLGGLLNFIVGVATFILWIVLMYKAYQGETYKLPIAGDIASGIVGKM